MELDVRRASASYFTVEKKIVVNTIEDLLEFVKQEGDIVINKDSKGFSILIYDDYIE